MGGRTNSFSLGIEIIIDVVEFPPGMYLYLDCTDIECSKHKVQLSYTCYNDVLT